MPSEFPFALLRPDAPTEPSFLINEIPYRAKLDQNESPVDVPDEVKAQILDSVRSLAWNRYPQPAQYETIKARFAAAIEVPAENLILTAGADQMILLAYWAAGGAGRRARIFEPTYPVFAVGARISQTRLDRVVLDADFDVAGAGLGDRVDLLMLVSPNNPTGGLIDRALIAEALTRNCLVFMDEAYADYARRSVVDLVAEHPNLLLARSLAKSSLAGIRLGYGVGHPELINVLERCIFAPYHLNFLQLALAENLRLVKPHLESMVAAVIAERGRVHAALEQLAVRVYPSRANFLLFAVDDAAATNRRLLDRGIRLRDVSTLPGLGQHLRVTIGTAAENDLFLEALAAAVC